MPVSPTWVSSASSVVQPGDARGVSSEAQERQRIPGGGGRRRCVGRVAETGEGVARVERVGGVEGAEQRAQVDVAERGDQSGGDGAVLARGGEVAVLPDPAEAEHVAACD